MLIASQSTYKRRPSKMGARKFYPLIHKRGVVPTPVDLLRLGTHPLLQIDLLGAFHAYKADEHANHEERRQKTLTRLDAELVRMETFSQNGKWTPESTYRKIQKYLRECYVFTRTAKQTLRYGMQDHFEVCLPTGEADTCISRSTGGWTQLNEYVVSGDSDLLIYGSVQRLIRPLPHG
ncbi:MAG: hypothetical protein J3Q66DRAFT_401008 [Benniella sp.]|nr:MAG: hypothetical protein J3Q66DRAFT_401008 [Benniella sp.]